RGLGNLDFGDSGRRELDGNYRLDHRVPCADRRSDHAGIGQLRALSIALRRELLPVRGGPMDRHVDQRGDCRPDARVRALDREVAGFLRGSKMLWYKAWHESRSRFFYT